MQSAELRAFRARHNLTQPQLAALLPLPVATLRDWERGRFKPPKYLQRALRDLERELTEPPAAN